MRSRIFCGGLLALAALAVPGWLGAADDKSTSGSPSSKSPEPSKERLTAAGHLLGEITKVSEDGKSLTLRMHQKVPQLNYSKSMGGAGGGCAT